jgi:hypothetical protein
MYVLKNEGQFEFVEPDDENCHLEVAVCDAAKAGSSRSVPSSPR